MSVIDTPIESMNPSQLMAHIQKLREIRANPAALRAALSEEEATATVKAGKKPRTKKPTLSFDEFV